MLQVSRTLMFALVLSGLDPVLPFKPPANEGPPQATTIEQAITDLQATNDRIADLTKQRETQAGVLKKLLDTANAKAKTLGVDSGSNPTVPQPMLPNPVAAKHLTFVSPTAAVAGVVNDTGLREFLKTAGVDVHVLAAGDPLPKGFAAAIDKAGGVPCVVVQDVDGNVTASGKLTTVEAVKGLVK